MQRSEMVILKLPILFVLVAAGFVPLGCAKNLDGNTTFREAQKGFEKEMPAQQRKQTIKALQAETTSRKADRTVTPLPPQVVTPVNPPPKP